MLASMAAAAVALRISLPWSFSLTSKRDFSLGESGPALTTGLPLSTAWGLSDMAESQVPQPALAPRWSEDARPARPTAIRGPVSDNAESNLYVDRYLSLCRRIVQVAKQDLW